MEYVLNKFYYFHYDFVPTTGQNLNVTITNNELVPNFQVAVHTNLATPHAN